ncbi:MAG: hypothetical protein BGO98_49015 [Myxococcales bacterium 68-20]|nr:hypothetical protein [Myxococcales bacterium]OJY29768.1 MAG: hypothetical protein BGO98_49015 [Myxococcales bacterium 68-20]
MKLRSLIASLSAAAAVSFAGAAVAAEPPEVSSSVPEPVVHHAPQPDTSFGYHQAVPRPTLTWALLQLVPSPEVAVGRQRHIGPTGNIDASARAAFGLRWQLTPVLWSFGVHPSQSRWRYLVVDPIARHSGSLELSASVEYIGGHIDSVLVRPGLRAYLPVAHRGEYLSVSLGTSVYAYDGLRVAYDVGAYILGGTVGVQMTVAPTHAPLAAIATLRLRYF